MNEILINAIALLLLVAAFAGLVAWVRRDTFTGAQYRRPEAPDAPDAPEIVEPTVHAPSIRARVLRPN